MVRNLADYDHHGQEIYDTVVVIVVALKVCITAKKFSKF
jgi:hypothetical protein